MSRSPLSATVLGVFVCVGLFQPTPCDAAVRRVPADHRTIQEAIDASKAGDTVLFGKYSGMEVKVEGEELLVMREDDIMAIIES